MVQNMYAKDIGIYSAFPMQIVCSQVLRQITVVMQWRFFAVAELSLKEKIQNANDVTQYRINQEAKSAFR